ncbi:MAG: alpha/beta hydrolase [Candidatus Hermodarchaeota archaeon]
MKGSTFTFKDQDGFEIFVYKWAPDSDSPKATIQIVHGLVEHAARYERVAEKLTSTGYICYANDQRGHGKTGGEENKGYLGENGWNGVLNDMKRLTDIIKKENPNIPCFLIGHSWGSLMTQDYIQHWGSELKGVVLSGTNGYVDEMLLQVGQTLIKKELKKHGQKSINEKFHKILFGPYNKPFEPAETEFQWLNRDQEEVNKYANDPYCGYAGTTNLYGELLYGVGKIWKEENERAIPVDLPIYLISGSEDPSNDMTKNLLKLIERYKNLGIKDLTYKIYDGARHEIFNEINREEVFQDVINWLNSHL